MFWSFKRKPEATPHEHVIQNTLLIISVNQAGVVTVDVVPRTPQNPADEDQSGGSFCVLYRALLTGAFSQMVINAIHSSSFSLHIQKKIIDSIDESSESEDLVDPRAVFPEA